MSPRPPANATTRFADRVEDYAKYRPSYPVEVIDVLRNHAGLARTSIVADVGAGTGIFTRILLDAGVGAVYAIEPNRAMHDALIAALGTEVRLRTLDGTAEHTGMHTASVHLITAAQAFHWFERDTARAEFQRILRPGGAVALIWNGRREDSTPFLVAYEALLQRWAPDYTQVNHRNVGLESLAPFFAPGPVERHAFPSAQSFDFAGLRGRLLSSSYAPAAGHPNHEPMLADLRRIFDAHHVNGQVRFEYETEVYVGRFGK